MRKIQCIRCIKQKIENCKDNDKFELRECDKFVPRTENNKIIEPNYMSDILKKYGRS